ncbi:hypothetical protein [Microbacterium sp. CGR1]|uniref:hypothetical protein n=1 Tax=Microbacterium sp. CGR1 TaxID=1696072 RepID=UPI003DA59511
MTAISALLFAYMSGLVLLALSWGIGYSVPQWALIGVMVAGSAALLVWQIRKVLTMRGKQPDK